MALSDRIPTFVLALGLRLGAAAVLQGALCWVAAPTFNVVSTPSYLQALIIMVTLGLVSDLLKVWKADPDTEAMIKPKVFSDGVVRHVLLTQEQRKLEARTRVIATYIDLGVVAMFTLILAVAVLVFG